jgi:hypothetical protein
MFIILHKADLNLGKHNLRLPDRMMLNYLLRHVLPLEMTPVPIGEETSWVSELIWTEAREKIL